tara:strand:- start:111 stop:251 length:141 start_codon:yes stop_codon:yes gene_type:complete
LIKKPIDYKHLIIVKEANMYHKGKKTTPKKNKKKKKNKKPMKGYGY